MSPSTDGAAPAAARRQHHIPELLEIHADELAYLWGQRRAAMFDPRYTLPRFVELNERIEAHVAGLLVVPSALPRLLGARLVEAADRDDAFAAACGLMRLENRALTERVFEVFDGAAGEVLAGLRDALVVAPLAGLAPRLQAVLDGGDEPHALAAAAALAARGMLAADAARLAALLMHDDAALAAFAWRVLALVDARAAAGPEPAPARPWREALSRPEPALRGAVLAAAAWSGQTWACTAARRLAERGCPVSLGWWAVLAAPDDGPALFTAAQALPPPARAALFGRWGDARAMPWLEQALRSGELATSAAAIEAWHRVTGVDLRGSRTVPPPAEDASEFEREMALPVWQPDLALLDEHAPLQREIVATGGRWNRGHALADPPAGAVLSRIDLPARWDALARAAAARRPLAAPPPPL